MQLHTILLLLFVCFTPTSPADVDDDLYDLLNVERDASERAIRKAFKKLALELHPDKNQDDPSAHDKFVKINRAYEVLKDEDMRKKYDEFGADAFKDGFDGGQQYQSWHFYKNDFGIYDDDVEIVTLSRSDFVNSVVNSQDIWFINFYSPQCSHCHDLAPTWRTLARELEGVVRVGAINCGDDWMLCREQGIHGYPALVVYPQRDVYQGSREKDDLLNFVLNRIPQKDKPLLLTSSNYKQQVAKRTEAAWLIDFCDSENTGCLSGATRRKLAAIFANGLCVVAKVDCVKDETLCEKFGMDKIHTENGGIYVRYFQATDLEDSKKWKKSGKRIDSLDYREIAFAVFDLLPKPASFDVKGFEKLQESIQHGKESPWVIEFTTDSDDRKSIEMQKLPAMMNSIQMGSVDCSKHRELCALYHVRKYPTFLVVKEIGYEIHYGRIAASDIASFARQSVTTRVRALNGADWLAASADTDSVWLIDFFTPWCPPCMRMLPEFRQVAHALSGDTNMHFGTVDCTVEQTVCAQAGVQSYPTLVMYNHSQPNQFVGLHSQDEILDFIEDIRSPSVVTLDAQSFARHVTSRTRQPGAIWVVDFFAPWCGPCQQLAPEWRKVAKLFRKTSNVTLASVDCVANAQLCKDQQVDSYPSIRLYLEPSRYILYQSWFRDSANIRQWIYQYLPQRVLHITNKQFDKQVLSGSKPYLVDFYAPWCGHCQHFMPEFELVSEAFEGLNVGFAKVNCDEHPKACMTAGVQAYPSVRLYKGASAGKRQDPRGIEIQSQSSAVIIDFLRRNLNVRPGKDEL